MDDTILYGHASRDRHAHWLARLKSERITETLLREIVNDCDEKENRLAEMADKVAEQHPNSQAVKDLLTVREEWVTLMGRVEQALIAIAQVRALSMDDDLARAIVISVGGTVAPAP